MAEYSMGIDLGGTNLRAAAIDSSGKMIDKIAGSTHLSAGREAAVADRVAAIRKLRQGIGTDSLAGVGVGVPGFIILEQGLIPASPNLRCFDNFPIRHAIQL